MLRNQWVSELKGERSMGIGAQSGEIDGHLKVEKSMGMSAQSVENGTHMLQHIAAPGQAGCGNHRAKHDSASSRLTCQPGSRATD